MNGSDCTRWIGLSDRLAGGEPVSDKDCTWLSQHASTCAECGAEAQFYASLRKALGHPERLVMPSQTAASPVPRRRLPRTLFVCMAAAAVVVAVAIGTRMHLRARTDRTTAPPSPVPIAAHMLFASGDAILGSAPARAGQPIAEGEHLSTGSGLACLRILNAGDVCLDGQATAALGLSDANQIVVYLDKGTLMTHVEHQAPGRKFLVRTASAEVQAVGTRFSVRLADDGSTRICLHEGKLAVRGTNRVSTDLVAPVQATIAGDIRVAPISQAAADDDQPLSQLFETAGSENGTNLMITSTPASADVLVDDVVMGKTPVSMFLAAAAHVRLSLAGYQPISEWIEVGDHPSLDLGFTLTPLPASRPVPPPPTHVRRAQVSPSKLLAQAQAMRSRSQYGACARLYRRLWSEFPESEEAKVSMISLGELELVHTKDPASALAAFNAYLRTGGPLEREARFGKIRALRMLGHASEAQAETARFLRDWPTSIQAKTLGQDPHGN